VDEIQSAPSAGLVTKLQQIPYPSSINRAVALKPHKTGLICHKMFGPFRLMNPCCSGATSKMEQVIEGSGRKLDAAQGPCEILAPTSLGCEPGLLLGSKFFSTTQGNHAMKMKLLSAAMLAGLGVAGSAQAVHVNPDGTGQVLLYPYYTVQNGYETYVSVVNTQNTTKAVKVRILEGMNSQEVLDFNLYLSPYDEWSAKIFRTDAGAAIMTTDTSCTSGQVTEAGISFRNYQYLTDAAQWRTLERTREGYIELIEMGNVIDTTLAAAIKHGSNGIPANCAAVRTASTSTGSVLNTQAGMAPPTGGLYGYGTTISVGSGLRTTYDATALDAFWNEMVLNSYHTTPGDVQPSLNHAASNPVAVLLRDGQAVNWGRLGGRPNVDPVSAVLMRSAIMNDYVVDTGRNSSTNWIVTFPTKRFYVNGAGAPQVPFATAWNITNATSCDPISVNYWDREERTTSVAIDDFSPQPPGQPGLALCHEVNTVSIKRDGDGSAASLYGAVYTHNSIQLASGFQLGWMKIDFDGASAYLPGDAEIGGVAAPSYDTLAGLPVIGYSAFTSENTLAGGLSNYMGSVVHKAETSSVAP
jgi:hypothetical protein